MPDVRRAVGDAGEDAVAALYEANGYRVIDRNWRVREGEIDVIAQQRATVVFCEVKTRRSDAFGIPPEAVGPRKQSRLRILAVLWLRAHADIQADVLRFDVASVLPNGRGWSVDVLEAAF